MPDVTISPYSPEWSAHFGELREGDHITTTLAKGRVASEVKKTS